MPCAELVHGCCISRCRCESAAYSMTGRRQAELRRAVRDMALYLRCAVGCPGPPTGDTGAGSFAHLLFICVWKFADIYLISCHAYACMHAICASLHICPAADNSETHNILQPSQRRITVMCLCACAYSLTDAHLASHEATRAAQLGLITS